MPVALTPKQEKFCLAYIEVGNASEAYRRSYDCEKSSVDTVNRKAKELLDNGKVAARLEELRAPIVERHKVTIDSLMAELEEARQAALSAETVQSSAAVSATMGKAKLCGLDKQVIEHTGRGGKSISFAIVGVDATSTDTDT
jgi:phage terminase small subunit